MGGSIPKENVITFPSLEEKSYILQEKNILMVLNADHQRYKNYIWLQNIIITIAIIKGCRKSFHYMGL